MPFPAFYVDAANANPGHHVCMVSTLSVSHISCLLFLFLNEIHVCEYVCVRMCVCVKLKDLTHIHIVN